MPAADDWIIQTTFPRSQDLAYWGRNRHGFRTLTLYRASAIRYESEDAALNVAYDLKSKHLINDFTVIRV
jgi:hypothetical protein